MREAIRKRFSGERLARSALLSVFSFDFFQV